MELDGVLGLGGEDVHHQGGLQREGSGGDLLGGRWGGPVIVYATRRYSDMHSGHLAETFHKDYLITSSRVSTTLSCNLEFQIGVASDSGESAFDNLLDAKMSIPLLQPQPPTRTTLEAFIDRHQHLLQLERAAEEEQTRLLNSNCSPRLLEQRGLALGGLGVASISVGLGGKKSVSSYS